MPNTLFQYYVCVAPPPELAAGVISELSPSLSIELWRDIDHETEVAQLTMSIIEGRVEYVLFPEVTNGLTEV